MFKEITMLYIKLKYRLDFFISYYCAYQLQKKSIQTIFASSSIIDNFNYKNPPK